MNTVKLGSQGAVVVKLSPAEVAELETAVPADAVAGGRYSDASMKTIDR